MGEVYRAYDRSHQREVAVKLLIESLSKDREYRARFEREARIAAGLREQHIIPIHRFGEIDNRLFIDMRLVDGEDLGKLLAREGALAPGRAVRIAAQVAAALDAAHLAGLVHRDVKPANVLIARTATAAADSVYLADFGIARAGDAGTNERLTMTGVTIGTPDYMAPERFTDGTADHRADIYALGCMLYEMLSGHKPFAAEGVLALAYKHVNEEAPRLCAARPDLPRALDEVVHRSMAKDPVHRYRSAGELAAAAEAALAPAGGSVPQPGRPRRPPGTSTRTYPAPPPDWSPLAAGRRWPRWFYDLAPAVGPAVTGRWPSATDYVRAIQAGVALPSGAGVQGAALVRDGLGMPATSSGQNAVVFELEHAEGALALRCFTRSPEDAAARYRALAPVLASSGCDVVAPARWVDAAVTVGNERWPAVVMPWVSGLPLTTAVEDRLEHRGELTRLAEAWLTAVRDMWDAGLAHGDLQCGNILVDRSGELHLVDLDGFYVPSLHKPPAELGHPDFQHPRRSAAHWGTDMDAFSGLAIYLGLRALAADPRIWRFNSGENLVLARDDYERPGHTPVWAELRASPDLEVVGLTEALIGACRSPDPPSIAEVRRILDGRGATGPTPYWLAPTMVHSPVSSGPPSAKWWVDEPETVASTPAAAVRGPSGLANRLGRNAVVTGLTAGLACALLIIITYAVLGDSIPLGGRAPLLVALAGGILTAGLAAIPRATMGAVRSAGSSGLVGGLLGAVLSLVALGAFEAVAYTAIPTQGQATAPLIAAWTLCAMSIGVAAGVVRRSGRAVVSGLLGGIVGGFLGGLVHWASGPEFYEIDGSGYLYFDPLDPATQLAVFLACASIGVAIGLVDRVRRTSWLTVIEGRLRGREVILDRREATIGSAGSATLRLGGDAGVRPVHAVLSRDQGGYSLRCHGPVEINGRASPPSRRINLASGDVLQVGGSFIRFEHRESR
jgi:serine/threonine protein kinase